jgi:hypothetical protein
MTPTPSDLAALKAECYQALGCLYIATEQSVADDVNAKVRAYITSLEKHSAPTPNDLAALRRLLERLRAESSQRYSSSGYMVVGGHEVFSRERLTDLAREADALIPVIERLVNPEPCVWRWCDDSCHYQTGCGEGYCFLTDDQPEAQHYRHCPGCGKPIRAEWKENEE